MNRQRQARATDWMAPYVACGRRVSYQPREEGRTPYKVLSIVFHGGEESRVTRTER
jgi:hypothetical protein